MYISTMASGSNRGVGVLTQLNIYNLNQHDEGGTIVTINYISDIIDST